MAVGRMDAMAACWGRSWMLSSSRAGYMPSLRDMWLTACSRESKSTANATSSSPSIMFLVVVHHSWPPAQNRQESVRSVPTQDTNSRPSCKGNPEVHLEAACVTAEVKQDVPWIISCFTHRAVAI